MAEKQYYCVTTRRFTLRCGHEEWLRMTQELYGQVILFYYHLFVDLEEKKSGSLTSLSTQLILRSLEVLTIEGRAKEAVPYPLPWVKLPLYFRRAAINEAVSCARTYFSSRKAGKYVGKASQFCKGITLYKGMYRELTEKNVTIKVWSGVTWVWMTCGLSGNFIPPNAQTLSPSILYRSKGTALLLPVRTVVEDGRKAHERMRQGSRVCSIQFANEDYFAVGVVLDENGIQQAVHFFKGGREYAHRCGEVLEKIQRSEQAMGMGGKAESKMLTTFRQEVGASIEDKTERNPIFTLGNEVAEAAMSPKDDRGKWWDERYNQKYWMKYKHIRQYQAHQVSRQILDFCLEQGTAVIAMPKYSEQYTKYVMSQTGKSSPLNLSKSICELLSYKAWQVGIIVLEVNSKDTSSYCSECGLPIKRKKDVYYCPNGHQGNKFLNTARNIGAKCLKGFDGEREA